MIIIEKMERIFPIIKKIWSFAKKHTSLFLGVSTVFTSIVTILLNVLVFTYQLGYYHYGYSIPISLLGTLYKSGISLIYIVSGIVMTCLLTIYTLMGVEDYKRHKYRHFLEGTFFVLFCSMAVLNFLITLSKYKLKFLGYWLGELLSIAILSILITMLLNSLTLSLIFSGSLNENKLCRLKVEKERINDGLLSPKTKEMKRMRLSEKRDEIEEKIVIINMKNRNVNKLEADDSNKVKSKVEVSILSCIMAVAVLVPLFLICGMVNANSENTYTIVANREDIYAEMAQVVPQDRSINCMVVLYQSVSTAIISPGYVKGGEIKIYSEVQRILPTENLTFVTIGATRQ